MIGLRDLGKFNDCILGDASGLVLLGLSLLEEVVVVASVLGPSRGELPLGCNMRLPSPETGGCSSSIMLILVVEGLETSESASMTVMTCGAAKVQSAISQPRQSCRHTSL